MEEQIETPQKELSDEEIANLLDAEFQNTGNHRNDWVQLQNKGSNEGYAKWNKEKCPDWSGSVVSLPVCKSKVHWLDSQSRAHAWVVSQVPSRGWVRGNYILMFLSLPSTLSKNK